MYSYGSSSSFLDLLGIGFGVLIVLLVLGVAIAIVTLVAEYKLFKKMNIDGLKSLVPGVSQDLQMEAIGMNQKWLLIITYASIVNVIPILGYLAYLVTICYFWALYCVGTAKSFGKDTGFGVLMFFFYPIMICILAFGDSKYIGANPMNDIIFKNNNSSNNNTKAAAGGKFCSNCGASVPSDSAFCTGCGTKVD